MNKYNEEKYFSKKKLIWPHYTPQPPQKTIEKPYQKVTTPIWTGMLATEEWVQVTCVSFLKTLLTKKK